MSNNYHLTREHLEAAYRFPNGHEMLEVAVIGEMSVKEMLAWQRLNASGGQTKPPPKSKPTPVKTKKPEPEKSATLF